MLVCEEMFLLLTTDEGKTEGWGTQKGWGLAGALLADLLMAERIGLSADKKPRLTNVSAEPTGNPIIDAALPRLRELEGKKLESVVQDRKFNPSDAIAESLAAQGVIGIEEKKMLGLVPARYPILNPVPEREIRARLRQVLAGSRATQADATLLSIAQGLEVAPKVFAEEKGSLSNRELKARIKEAATTTEGTAVAKAVEQLNAAIIATAIIPVVTGATSS